MAWIKVRHGLERDPAVIKIAGITGLDEDHVVGKLVRLWCWADEELADGRADGVTVAWLDHYLGVSGFAAAMCEAGWLAQTETGLRFPRFSRHMGESAKRRAEAQRRKAESRRCHTKRVTDVTKTEMPDESKMRERVREEEKKDEEDITVLFVQKWNALGHPFKQILHLGSRQKELLARWRDKFFREHWDEAMAHMPLCPFLCGQNDRKWLADVEFFLRPNSVVKILEGKYDGNSAVTQQPQGEHDW